LVEELRGGSSLSQALSKYPQAFSYTYCQVIKASEQTGNIEVGLRHIASYMDRQAKTKKKITRALVYPAMVLIMAIAVSILLTVVVLPPLIKLFTSLGTDLPWTTNMLIATASFVVDYKLYLLGGVLIVIVLIVGYLRLPAGKLNMDRLMLKAPVIGPINLQRNMCQFCRTTSMLLKAGLLLPHIMNTVIRITGSPIIRHALRDVREKLVQGQGLSQPMATNEIFPRLLVEMAVVGEKTGSLESTLATLADLYEEKVNQRIDALISMIEPVLTVAIGLLVLFIALSMITPLYSILGSMK